MPLALEGAIGSDVCGTHVEYVCGEGDGGELGNTHPTPEPTPECTS